MPARESVFAGAEGLKPDAFWDKILRLSSSQGQKHGYGKTAVKPYPCRAFSILCKLKFTNKARALSDF